MDPSEVADTVRRAATGDQVAWNALVEAYSGMVWAVASGFRLGRADVAEISQTTWMRLVEHLDRLDHPERVGGWLATTARHEGLRLLRLRARETPVADVDPPADGGPTPESLAVDGDRARTLWSAFGRLPDNCRTLLRLCVIDRPPYAEIAELLNMPIGSIGPTRARCLQRLKKLLVADGLNAAGGA